LHLVWLGHHEKMRCTLSTLDVGLLMMTSCAMIWWIWWDLLATWRPHDDLMWHGTLPPWLSSPQCSLSSWCIWCDIDWHCIFSWLWSYWWHGSIMYFFVAMVFYFMLWIHSVLFGGYALLLFRVWVCLPRGWSIYVFILGVWLQDLFDHWTYLLSPHVASWTLFYCNVFRPSIPFLTSHIRGHLL